MQRSVTPLLLAVSLAFALGACGGNQTSMQSATMPSGSSTSNVSLSIGDAPPTGVTILRFELQVMSASLQPADSTQPAVSMLTKPQDVELEHLQTEPAFLVNRNVPAGTYNSLSVTFANPQMTIFNQTGSTLTVGSQSCATNQVCNLTPTLNQMTVTVQQPTAPFPLTLSASSPVAFLLHFDINNSVQNDLSITPSISLKQLPHVGAGEFEHFHVVGTVSAIASPDFTLQTAFGNQSLTIATDGNTQYSFGTSCQANDFTCIATGQLLKVKVSLMSGGTLLATSVELFSQQNIPSFQGVVTSTNASQNQFQVALFFMDDEEHQFGQMSPGFGLTIQPTASATFSIDSDGITVPSGLSFASIQDITVGQVIRFQPSLPVMPASGSMGQFTINASSLTLEPSEITGIVAAVNSSATPPNFTLGNLPPLFTNSSISQLEIEPVAGTEFDNVSGLSAINVNDSVSVAGLLFNTSAGPVVIAERVSERGPFVPGEN
jgi:Domain of unknown function (DUF5666)/Domain of unknown function (DUF4382)